MNKAALITGGAVRLGRELAIHLAGLGYDIALHYNSSEGPARKTAREIETLGVNCELFACNFNDSPDYGAFMSRVLERFADLSVLINSASVYEQATLQETDEELFDRQFRVNLRAPFFLSGAFARHVYSHASRTPVSRSDAAINVINIIDNKIAFNQNRYGAYLLSKKSLADLTKMMALEFAPLVRVNGIAPGVVMPAESRTTEYIDWRVAGIPLRRRGAAEDILGALEYILQAKFLNGQILMIDGGEGLTNTGRNAGEFESPDKI